jgi:3-oxoacyl-[acyl-carrier protein] reductase
MTATHARRLAKDSSHEGKVAVVTGAARNIGRAIAEGLAARGAKVMAVDLEEAVDTVAAILDAGGTAAALVADVSSETDVRSLPGAVEEVFGPCSVLVNNAGICEQGGIIEIDPATWRRILSVNLDSQFLTARAFAPGMIAMGWGRIVNVSSSSIYTSAPGLTAYMASKAGVLGLTSGMANDLGAHGITVNAVAPALTRTAIHSQECFDEALPLITGIQTIKQEGRVQDIVGLVAFLTSDEAYFVTGQFVRADGGLSKL